jgi:phage terminase small subunit
MSYIYLVAKVLGHNLLIALTVAFFLSGCTPSPVAEENLTVLGLEPVEACTEYRLYEKQHFDAAARNSMAIETSDLALQRSTHETLEKILDQVALIETRNGELQNALDSMVIAQRAFDSELMRLGEELAIGPVAEEDLADLSATYEEAAYKSTEVTRICDKLAPLTR